MEVDKGVEPKIGYTKMDGENNGTPYEQMDDLGGKNPYFWKHLYLSYTFFSWNIILVQVKMSV